MKAHINTNTKKLVWTITALIPFTGYSQQQTVSPSPEGFANPFLWFLLAIIILLAFVISTLASAIKNVSNARMNETPIEKKPAATIEKGKNIAGLFILFFLFQQTANAEDLTIYSGQEKINGIDFGSFYFLIAVIAFELICVFTLLNVLKGKLAPFTVTKPVKPLAAVKKKTLIEQLNASVEIEKEKDILLDHDYDGIKELDNNLPPWWKYGFYLTIVVAVIYLFHYHVLRTGDLQLAELQKNIESENLKIAEYMKLSASNVDETTIKYLESESDLKEGKDIFINNCSACHGNLGEGKVGPNLTDNYWLHGGSLSEVFKSIKYGWTEKGMKSWKDDFSPMQIARLTSFIKSINGTNPPNAKEKQGELFSEGTIQSDSTNTVNDSLKIAPADSASLKK